MATGSEPPAWTLTLRRAWRDYRESCTGEVDPAAFLEEVNRVMTDSTSGSATVGGSPPIGFRGIAVLFEGHRQTDGPP